MCHRLDQSFLSQSKRLGNPPVWKTGLLCPTYPIATFLRSRLTSEVVAPAICWVTFTKAVFHSPSIFPVWFKSIEQYSGNCFFLRRNHRWVGYIPIRSYGWAVLAKNRKLCGSVVRMGFDKLNRDPICWCWYEPFKKQLLVFKRYFEAF